MKTKCLAAGAAFLLLFQGACVDLVGVKRFASLAQQQAQNYTAMVEGMYGTCIAEYGFDPPAAGTPESVCGEWRTAEDGMLKLGQTLSSYMQGLGQLATGGAVVPSAASTSMQTSLEGITVSGKAVLNKAQVSGAMGMGGFVSNIATEGLRRRQLGRVIYEQNTNVAAITAALVEIVKIDENLLANERVAVEAFEIRTARAGGEPLAAEIGKREAESVLAGGAMQKAADDRLVAFYNQVAADHQVLFANRHHLGSRQVITLFNVPATAGVHP